MSDTQEEGENVESGNNEGNERPEEPADVFQEPGPEVPATDEEESEEVTDEDAMHSVMWDADTGESPPDVEQYGGEDLEYPPIFNPDQTDDEPYEGFVLPETSPYPGESPFLFDGERESPGSFYYAGEMEQEESVTSERRQEDEEEGEGEGDEVTSTSSLSQVYSKLSPYFIKWSFGLKVQTKLINLTKDNRFEVFFATSHFGVIYDYRTNSVRFLPGHNSLISSIAADASGRWLVTADEGDDNVIIVWDHERRVPCWSLYNIFSDRGTRFVQISHDARFLAAVSGGAVQTCKFYLWTYGREEADGTFDLDRRNGEAVHIQFNHLDTNQFAVTTESRLVFCRWDPEAKAVENFTTSPIKYSKSKIGAFRESLYLDDNHSSITSTGTGCIVVWCDVIHLNEEARQKPGTISKKYLKSIKIHKSAVTSMQLADHVLVTSSEDGIISFHDQTLSLLYWVPKYVFEPVVCVSCNLLQQQGDQLDPFSDEFDDLISSNRSTSEEEIEDLVPEEYWGEDAFEEDATDSDEDKVAKSDPNKSIEFADDGRSDRQRPAPSDCTIERKPFHMRDFIFLNSNGRFGYVSHFRTKVRYFLYNCEAPVLSVDCNPNKDHLAVGNALGRVDLYEHKRKKLLASATVANSGVANLRYSPTGRYLMAGLKNGGLLILDPFALTVKFKIQIGKSEIVKMCLTSNERFLAFYDRDDTVHLYKKGKSHAWIFMGGYKSHFKPISDIMFDEECDEGDRDKAPRLFTIGEDRMLVEYDMKNLQPGALSLKAIDRIEQTAIPRCFTILPTFGKKVCYLVSNDEYKLKVLERNARICAKTIVGPTADTPMNFMKVIPGWTKSSKTAKMIYTTEKHIGLRMLPATGNPFEGIGMVGHPVRITSVATSHNHKYIFTAGSNDSSVLMWKINSKSVDIAFQLGGTGIEPFMALIEGGANGFLFKEMQDFFYYSQIIHQGEHANLDRSVSKTLALCEIPDMVRSLGYYPTDYEIANMVYEVRNAGYEETGEYTNEITFEESVKIYLNHRPVNGISLDRINKALLTVADLSDPECIIIEKEELYKALEEHAEAMSHAEVVGYLCILLLPKDERDPIPDSMTLRDFADDVLGIDLTITEDAVREVTHPFENKDF